MKLKVLGSSSSGNAYILDTGKEALLLEAGLPFKRIQEGLDFDIGKVSGCLVSHEHKDHSKAIEALNQNGVSVYTSKGTIDALGLTESHRLGTIKALEAIKVGGFVVLPFDVQHDAVEPLGFLVQHDDMGKLLFVTDTYYCKYKFEKLDHVLVECNYRQSILDSNVDEGKVHPYLKGRIERSHFELENVKDFLRSSDLSVAKNIVLIHLSSQNSDGEFFKSEIEKTTGRQTFIAKRGLELDIEKDVF